MKVIRQYILWIVICLCASCSKYLDKIPDPTLAIPNTVSDLQALFDDYAVMNLSCRTALEVMADNYYVLPADLNSVTNASFRGMYTWQPDNSSTNDWYGLYTGPIKKANVVLDNILNVPDNGSTHHDLANIRGAALFYRGFYLYLGAQLFAQPYQKATAGTTLGIPLRLDGDMNKVSVRGTLAGTYAQIIQDLADASIVLPDKQLLKSIPTKAAAYGALARTYLAMSAYELAGKFADLCIKSYGPDSLIDYNTVSTTAVAPFKRFNKEVIFQALGAANTVLANSRAKIDSNLYLSYNDNDLRKKIFFKSNGNNTCQFKGDYDGVGTSTGYVFGGIVLDEMYLVRAECYARGNQVPLAMADLNKLMAAALVQLWNGNPAMPIVVSDIAHAEKLYIDYDLKGTLNIDDLNNFLKSNGLEIVKEQRRLPFFILRDSKKPS
jgi:hypothetical protein